jgi:hypothetical protein
MWYKTHGVDMRGSGVGQLRRAKAAGVWLGIRISATLSRMASTTNTTTAPAASRLCPHIPQQPATQHAAPVAGHAPRPLAPVRHAPDTRPRCNHRPTAARGRTAAMRVDSLFAIGQPGRIQQEDPPRSRSGVGQGQDGRTRPKGPACTRKGASRLRGWADAAVHHQPREGPGQIQSVSCHWGSANGERTGIDATGTDALAASRWRCRPSTSTAYNRGLTRAASIPPSPSP